jgi:predicted AlkP superfamily phosphohydrolase/phosphomutase
MSKVLVIGLDSATLDLVEPWAKQGKLPALAKLMADGMYGPLRSVMPVLSSAAWSSFMTGVNPGKHSIYDFMRRDPGTYRLRLVRREHNQAPSLWRLLSQEGKRVGVINVPMTYSPEEVNGFLVSGLGTPEFKPFTFPPELGDELRQRGYRVNKRTTYQPGKEAAYLQDIYELAERQFESSLWLMKRAPWDFFMTVFFDTDQISHTFWRYMDAAHPQHDPAQARVYGNAILEFHQKLDGYIAALIEAAGPGTTVLIVSDHGAGPLYKDVFLNEWLRAKGYLAIDQNASLSAGGRGLAARMGLTRNGISRALRRLGLQRVETAIKELLGDRIELLPKTRRVEFPQAIDWSKTRAYSFGYQGQIYINLKGREPQGIVENGQEYEQLCQEIIDALFELVDPQDGQAVLDCVHRKEQVFQGPYLEYAPDLILEMRGLAYQTRQGYEFGEQAGKIFSTPVTFDSGSHRRDGLLIAGGDKVRRLGRVDAGANLIDLAPTILALLDSPIPFEMDGTAREDLFHLPPLKRQMTPTGAGAPTRPVAFTDEEEQEMIERLKGLGYLE